MLLQSTAPTSKVCASSWSSISQRTLTSRSIVNTRVSSPFASISHHSNFSKNLADKQTLISLTKQFHSSPLSSQEPQSPSPTARPSGPITPDISLDRTDRAEKAAKVNLAAKLSDDGTAGKSSSTTSQDAKRLVNLARPESRNISYAIVLLLISSAITMSVPFSMGKIIDIFTSDKKTLLGLSGTALFTTLGGIFLIGAICNMGRVILMRVTGERIIARVRNQLYERVIANDAQFFDSNRTGALISRISTDTSIVGKALTNNISDGLRAVVSATVGLGMMLYVSSSLTGIMLCIVPPMAIGGFYYGRYVKEISRKTQSALAEMTKTAEERLNNIRTIQAFSQEHREVASFKARTQAVLELATKEAFASGSFYGGAGFSGNLSILAVLGIGGGMVARGTITIGDLTSFLLYTAYVGGSVSGLTGFYSEIMKGIGAGSRLFELLDRKPPISLYDGVAVKDPRGKIVFENVGFAYPTRPALRIFDNLSFTIEPGTSVAIVGQSGQGKSTIASLLLRYYDPIAGKILIGDQDLKSMRLGEWRTNVGMVSQEPVLFAGTIAENIAYGKPDATLQEIKAAALRANCGFIADLPQGLETDVGPRGLSMSGGMKQRIAIARALLRDPSILILDEATSALDANSEFLVNDVIRSISGKTIITIAHRLSTIQSADIIIVLGESGNVAEIGSYEELANKNGAFSRLMRQQMWGMKSASRQSHTSKEHNEEEVQAA